MAIAPSKLIKREESTVTFFFYRKYEAKFVPSRLCVNNKYYMVCLEFYRRRHHSSLMCVPSLSLSLYIYIYKHSYINPSNTLGILAIRSFLKGSKRNKIMIPVGIKVSFRSYVTDSFVRESLANSARVEFPSLPGRCWIQVRSRQIKGFRQKNVPSDKLCVRIYIVNLDATPKKLCTGLLVLLCRVIDHFFLCTSLYLFWLRYLRSTLDGMLMCLVNSRGVNRLIDFSIRRFFPHKMINRFFEKNRFLQISNCWRKI